MSNEIETLRCLRYSDLVELGIIRNRMTLKRWVESGNFPPPIRLGSNSIAWISSDVQAWLDARIAESGPDEAERGSA